MPCVLSPAIRALAACGAALLAACSSTPLPPWPAGGSSESASSRTMQVLRFGNGQLELRADGEHCLLRWRGAFPAYAVDTLNEALRAMEPLRCARKTLALDLQGGDLGAAITLGAMLKNRQFDTELMPAGRCHTPCVLLFAAGRQRRMPEGGQPGELQLTQLRRDPEFGQSVCASELDASQRLTLTRYLRAMLPPETANWLYQKINQSDCRRHDSLGAPEALAVGLATGVFATGAP